MSTSSAVMDIPKIIYVMGIDGSGKSTVSEHLARRLRDMGYQVEVEWLRFNHVLSKPLLGLCRLIGLTRYEVSDGIRVGYHDFHRSRVVSWLFVLLQYLDAWRVLQLKIKPRMKGEHKILILDRYVYDILVDLMVDTRFEGLLSGRTGDAFLSLLPPDSKLLLVDRALDEVLGARPEGRVDANFIERYRHYKRIERQCPVEVLRNNGELAGLLQAAERSVGIRL